MNFTRSVLAALLVAVVVPAQAVDASAPKLAEYDKLVAEWTAATKASQEATKALVASDAYKEALAAKDQKKLTELRASVARPDGKAFGARAIALADQYAGDDSLRVLVYAAANFADKDTAKAVGERVEKDFLQSPKLGDLLENAMTLQRGLGEEAGNQLLDRVIAESPHAVPKAWAKYWQAKSLVNQSRTFQRTADKKDASAEEKAKAAEDKAKATAKADALFAEAAKLSAGTEHGLRIGAPVFEKERLQVGMQAPDIVGEDVDGVAFKLSDYRGKVVLLDYWGFW
ncbi:MAG: hypothetical protein WAT39_23490 [Planctomycetota bacterium]